MARGSSCSSARRLRISPARRWDYVLLSLLLPILYSAAAVAAALRNAKGAEKNEGISDEMYTVIVYAAAKLPLELIVGERRKAWTIPTYLHGLFFCRRRARRATPTARPRPSTAVTLPTCLKLAYQHTCQQQQQQQPFGTTEICDVWKHRHHRERTYTPGYLWTCTCYHVKFVGCVFLQGTNFFGRRKWRIPNISKRALFA